MDINTWLQTFKTAWQKHNIDGVMDLFSDDLEYFETPFQKIADKAELKKEWQAIKNQKNIVLDYRLFSSDDNSHSVTWELKYIDQENNVKQFAGTYLVKLNKEGRCAFFHHTCEEKK